MSLPPTERHNSETVLGFFSVTRIAFLHSAMYNAYFTERRVIFAKLGGVLIPPTSYSPANPLAGLAWASTEGKRVKKRLAAQNEYGKMTPQEIADREDNVAVLYYDILSVRVKGVRQPSISFVFTRKQKLGWDKIDFSLLTDPGALEGNLQAAGKILRRFLPGKIDNQLKDTKYDHSREIFERG